MSHRRATARRRPSVHALTPFPLLANAAVAAPVRSNPVLSDHAGSLAVNLGAFALMCIFLGLFAHFANTPYRPKQDQDTHR